MTTFTRRQDIDALRVIAIALLIVYHVAIGFQSWGLMVGFIGHVPSADALWLPMTALNIWRIPLLFFVSGMGVYLAFGKRTPFQLLAERSRRILLPFVFGMLCIVPLHSLVLQGYYGWPLRYSPGPGHLWFLGNILIYTIVLLPLLAHLQRSPDSPLGSRLQRWVAHPLGWLIILAIFAGEALVMNPYPFELYAMTWHGFWIGLLAFLAGYLFVFSGTAFWQRIVYWRWGWLVLAVALFTLRTITAEPRPPAWLLSIESNAWVLTVLAFGHKHINRPGAALGYLSQAAYPVYITHMVWLYLASAVIFPLTLNVYLKFILVLALTAGACLFSYEYGIRRVRWLRPLFGLKNLNLNRERRRSGVQSTDRAQAFRREP